MFPGIDGVATRLSAFYLFAFLFVGLGGCDRDNEGTDGHPSVVASVDDIPRVLEERSWPILVQEPMISGVVVPDLGPVLQDAVGGMWLLRAGDSAITEAQRIHAGDRDPALLLPPHPGAEDPRFFGLYPTSGRVLLLDAGGRVLEGHAMCPVPPESSGGVVLSSGMAVLSPSQGLVSLVFLHYVHESGQCRVEDSLEIQCAAVRPSLVRADDVGNRLLLSCDLGHPLWEIRRNADGSFSGEPILESIPEEGIQSPVAAPNWFTLPLLAVEGGFVRMSTDVRSSWRAVDQWDLQGQHLGTYWVEDAIGFAFSHPGATSIFGTRAGAPDTFVRFRSNIRSSRER
jgi:hypothetical protein